MDDGVRRKRRPRDGWCNIAMNKKKKEEIRTDDGLRRRRTIDGWWSTKMKNQRTMVQFSEISNFLNFEI